MARATSVKTPKSQQAKAAQESRSKELREEYGRWLIDPFREGTQAEWATVHGVAEETVSRWRKHPEVEAILKEWRTPFEADFALVMRRITRIALTGEHKDAIPAARLMADTMGQISPKKLDLTGRMGLIEFLGTAVAES